MARPELTSRTDEEAYWLLLEYLVFAAEQGSESRPM